MSISRHQATAVYQLRIQLRGISPPIWRRLLIPVNSTILNLHEAIQAAMGGNTSISIDSTFGDSYTVFRAMGA